MAKKKNFYVVWKGVKPGIYTNWDDCKNNVHGFVGAEYMGFETREEADIAYKFNYSDYLEPKKQIAYAVKPSGLFVCVDAACSGNPGKMEYQGVWGEDGDIIFKKGPFSNATNNIGEFLAIVHALAWLNNNNLNIPIYSDSVTAIAWVKNQKAKTKLIASEKNSEIFDLINRAETWLQTNLQQIEVRKWDTESWGEIPADFGRK